MNFIRITGFIAVLVTIAFEIYDHNIMAAMGWGIASLYMGEAMVRGLFEV